MDICLADAEAIADEMIRPFAHQRRLAEPCRSGDQRQRAVLASIQTLDQVWVGDEFQSGVGDEEFCG